MKAQTDHIWSSSDCAGYHQPLSFIRNLPSHPTPLWITNPEPSLRPLLESRARVWSQSRPWTTRKEPLLWSLTCAALKISAEERCEFRRSLVRSSHGRSKAWPVPALRSAAAPTVRSRLGPGSEEVVWRGRWRVMDSWQLTGRTTGSRSQTFKACEHQTHDELIWMSDIVSDDRSGTWERRGGSQGGFRVVFHSGLWELSPDKLCGICGLLCQTIAAVEQCEWLTEYWRDLIYR